jgi:hypothetical protein
MHVTQHEWDEIIKAFHPVIKEKQLFASDKDFENKVQEYKR